MFLRFPVLGTWLSDDQSEQVIWDNMLFPLPVTGHGSCRFPRKSQRGWEKGGYDEHIEGEAHIASTHCIYTQIKCQDQIPWMAWMGWMAWICSECVTPGTLYVGFAGGVAAGNGDDGIIFIAALSPHSCQSSLCRATGWESSSSCRKRDLSATMDMLVLFQNTDESIDVGFVVKESSMLVVGIVVKHGQDVDRTWMTKFCPCAMRCCVARGRRCGRSCRGGELWWSTRWHLWLTGACDTCDMFADTCDMFVHSSDREVQLWLVAFNIFWG